MYGTWQLGWQPVDRYVRKHNAAAALIQKEAPTGILVACGDTSTRGWDTAMLTSSGENLNLLSLHTYVHEVAGDPYAHSVQLRASIRDILGTFRTYKSKFPVVNQKDIRVAGGVVRLFFDKWIAAACPLTVGGGGCSSGRQSEVKN